MPNLLDERDFNVRDTSEFWQTSLEVVLLVEGGWELGMEQGLRMVGNAAARRLLSCPCFSGDTTVATAKGNTDIDSIELGVRVLPDEPGCHATLSEAYVRVLLSTEESERGDGEVELLRPLSWVEANRLEVGRTHYVNLPEVEISGDAVVVSLESAPAPAPGVGCVVTALFRHRSADLVQLRFDRGSPVNVTTGHWLRSTTRSWTRAGDLAIGEELQTDSGVARLLERNAISDAQDVYNIEVAEGHQYYVGEVGLLAHNACACGKASSKLLGKALELAGQTRRANHAAHHIVAGGAADAAPAQAVLNKFGVGINEAVNGVFLPGRAFPKGTLGRHAGGHSAAYYDAVNNALAGATSRPEVEQILAGLAQDLATGALKL